MEISAPLYFLDFETFSDKDLGKVGQYRYLYSDKAEIVCAAIATGVDEPVSFDLCSVPELPSNAVLVAHNASFEQTICRRFIPEWFDLKWVDTSALCVYNGYPRGLDNASEHIGLDIHKDIEGKKVLDKTLKKSIMPTAAELKILIKYNLIDVAICQQVFYQLIKSFPEKEQLIWEITNRANHRGIRVDLDIARKAQEHFNRAHALIAKRVPILTEGKLYSINQVSKIATFLGYENAQKATLEEKLKTETDPIKIELINHRLIGGQKACNKFGSILAREQGSRIRDAVVYYGCITGRFTSEGVQVQNVKKAPKKECIKNINLMKKDKHISISDLYTVIKGVFLPNSGQVLVKADYSNIEARIIAWISGEDWLLKAFSNGDPVYEKMASYIFKVPVEEVTEHQRFIGKSAVLGCGYGMGFKRFKEQYKVTEEEAQYAVRTYRNSCSKIVSFWVELEKSMKRVLESGEKEYLGKISIRFTARHLRIGLPSGRDISYLDPKIIGREITFKRPKIMLRVSYWGGSFTENICQGISRDILCDAFIRLEGVPGLKLLFNVHDELVYTMNPDLFSLEQFRDKVIQVPDWGTGLPISCTADCADRYYKD